MQEKIFSLKKIQSRKCETCVSYWWSCLTERVRKNRHCRYTSLKSPPKRKRHISLNTCWKERSTRRDSFHASLDLGQLREHRLHVQDPREDFAVRFSLIDGLSRHSRRQNGKGMMRDDGEGESRRCTERREIFYFHPTYRLMESRSNVSARERRPRSSGECLKQFLKIENGR